MHAMAYTFRIHCAASGNHSLAIVNGEVWYKDLSYGVGLKDEAGSPAFALVNKSTGEALKHSFGYKCPVRAIRFDPLYVDESILWAESNKEELKQGSNSFRRIHMVNNMDYIFDAERTVLKLGAARHGTRLILFRWNGGWNQLWRIEPHSAPSVALSSSEHAHARRQSPCWVQSFHNTGHVMDEEGHRAFALVNRATGEALEHSSDCSDDELVPVQLAGHSPDSVHVALLWTQSDGLGQGFHGIRAVHDTGIVLDAANAEGLSLAARMTAQQVNAVACTLRIHCGTSDDHSLAIVNSKVVADPCDDRQARGLYPFIPSSQNFALSCTVYRQGRSPALALVNKSTGEALKHFFGYNCPVRTIRFDPFYVDESVLWAESMEEVQGSRGFRRIHMIIDQQHGLYIFDAERAVRQARRSTTRHAAHPLPVEQRQEPDWRIELQPQHSAPVVSSEHAHAHAPARQNPVPERRRPEPHCSAGSRRLSTTLGARDGRGLLRAFALVNQLTGKALKHGHCGDDELVQLDGYNPDSLHVALSWTQSDDLGEGFHEIWALHDIHLVLHETNAGRRA
ncbi:hypothetical protein PR202_gb19732 [Eleusine coracana subsp. coracana]|uniref:Uncharacterized protein n=1 Tax=Eleusine coracana subsp. coracana TaxID=191504 RepID=A0AAV5F9L1_ELECO|nr:hypothetical protein PR202_gb19732 [Eleusine coracana subsp. coracana]